MNERGLNGREIFKMTEIENYANNVRWDPGVIDDDFDAGNNSSKLFERSRIKALAGKKYFINLKVTNKYLVQNSSKSLRLLVSHHWKAL